jgi:hypothetical protein
MEENVSLTMQAMDTTSHDIGAATTIPSCEDVIFKAVDMGKRDREEYSIGSDREKKCPKKASIPPPTFATLYNTIIASMPQEEYGNPDPLLLDLFAKFSKAEEVLFVNGTSDDLCANTSDNSSTNHKRRVRFATCDFSVVEVPTPKNAPSLAPFETLNKALGEIDEASSRLKTKLAEEEVDTTTDEKVQSLRSQRLLEQLKYCQQRLSLAKRCKTSEYLSKEISSLLCEEVVSNVKLRRAELLSSLIRYQFKQLMNMTTASTPIEEKGGGGGGGELNNFKIVIKARTGNLLQNFEDPGALFHHALKIYGSYRDMMHEFSDSEVIQTFMLKKKRKELAIAAAAAAVARNSTNKEEGEAAAVVVEVATSVTPPTTTTTTIDDTQVASVVDSESSMKDDEPQIQEQHQDNVSSSSSSTTTTALLLRGCDISSVLHPLIESLKSIKGSWAFMKPVQELWPELEEDYGQHVKQPMDLGTLLKNLKAGDVYLDVESALKDFRSVFHNAALFNGEGSDVVNIGKNMEVGISIYVYVCLFVCSVWLLFCKLSFRRCFMHFHYVSFSWLLSFLFLTYIYMKNIYTTLYIYSAHLM